MRRHFAQLLINNLDRYILEALILDMVLLSLKAFAADEYLRVTWSESDIDMLVT